MIEPNINLKDVVVFQNQDFVVIDKPAGVSFHSEESAGLVVLVKQLLRVEALFPVHRLDKMTSGLVVFALNKATAQAFQRLFEQRRVRKYYLALSAKKPKKKQGWVIGDMVPARRGQWKLSPTKEKPAKTQFISQLIGPGLRLFLVNPITGKTHQIRVALKSLGAPIIGDVRYAETAEAKRADRGYLHAFALQFTLENQLFEFVRMPIDGELFHSDACQKVLETWQTPWQIIGGEQRVAS